MKLNPFKIQEGTIRDSRVKNFSSDRFEGDSVFFSHSSSWLGKSLRVQTLVIFYFLVVALFGLLCSRAFYLQVVTGSSYLRLAEGNRLRQAVIKAPRGIIYDRNHKPLVYNSSFFFLYINPNSWPKDQAEQQGLKQLISHVLEQEDWEKLLKSGTFQSALIAEKLPYNQALELMALSRNHPSIEVTLEPSRDYVRDSGLSHSIGYVGQLSDKDLKDPQYADYVYNDLVGKVGIESEYEKYLRGTNGYEKIETDALGRDLENVSSKEPEKGHDVTLTIDLDIQKKLYAALNQIGKDYGRTRSAGIVMNPNNGEILAAVSMPDYDNNVFSNRLTQEDFQNLIANPDRPLFDRTVSGEYPPGSTFKIVMASAALQEKVIDTAFTVLSTGGVHIGNAFYPDWRPGGHGLTNIYHALADSVNTFFYLIGGGDNQHATGLGLERIRKYTALFGLGQKTGIDLPAESEGFIPSEDWKKKVKGDRWYLGDTYNISIGQGDIVVTPLQMAKYTSIIASKGVDVTPHFLKEIASQPAVSLPQFPSQNVSWLAPDTIEVVRKGLRETVINGTAQSLQAVNVSVAGKTGTAQFNRNKIPHSWFTGFAPYDQPELEVTILVEEGGDVGYAVKAARLFLQSYFNK